MKRKIIILVVLTLLFVSTAGFVSAESSGAKTVLAFEKADIADASVSASILNVRQGPSVAYPVICKLEKGQAVKIIGKIGEWYAVYNLNDGCIGAVDGKYLIPGESALQASSTTGSKTEEAIQTKTEPTKVTPTKAPAKAVPTKTPAPKVTPSKTTPKQVDTTTKVDVSQDEQKLFELVNKARKDAGAEPLAFDENLLKIARLKAGDMASNGYFSHQSPTYGSPFDMMRQYDNTFKTAGENIAGNKTIEGAFKAWMASEGHKKNILNSSFSVTGIGIVSSETYGKIIVQQFIGR